MYNHSFNGKIILVITMIDNNLRYCREELEMTQEELGIILGASKQTISNWETGYIFMPLTKLVRFCNLYNYSLDFVVGFTRKNIKYNKEIKLDSKLIGNNLKTLRKKLNLTQQKLSDKCNLYQATYNHYETGYSLIKIMPAYSICKTYNVSMDWLVGRKNSLKIDK